MEKKWYQSKSVWSAIAMGVVGILTALGVAVPDYVVQILIALGIYGVRDGIGTEIK